MRGDDGDRGQEVGGARMRSRWPITVMILRSQGCSLTDREIQVWTDRTADMIARGRADLVRPNWTQTAQSIWLFAGDPP